MLSAAVSLPSAGSIPVLPSDDYFTALFGSDHPLPR